MLIFTVNNYLVAEIVGRLDINPFLSLKNFSIQDLNKLFEMVYTCIIQSYEFGGGELINWSNPIYKSRIDDRICFYGGKEICVRQKFGTRNVWINRKWKIIK